MDLRHHHKTLVMRLENVIKSDRRDDSRSCGALRVFVHAHTPGLVAKAHDGVHGQNVASLATSPFCAVCCV